MTDVSDLRRDLTAEQEALDAIVGDLAEDRWQRPTSSPGWTVADQIGHLTYFDSTATLAIVDPDAFRTTVGELLGAGEGGAIDGLTLHRHLGPVDLLDAWRANRAGLAEAAATLADGARVPWYGPPMSARSFLTARMMECWAHGQDVVDALGAEREPTARLRHVAQIGFLTRGWSYVNRGLEPPTGPVRLELTPPEAGGEERWTWGPDDAADAVRGPALDFCLVVTQRRHAADTALEVVGDLARGWLDIAQAFAGPATRGPARRGS